MQKNKQEKAPTAAEDAAQAVYSPRRKTSSILMQTYQTVVTKDDPQRVVDAKDAFPAMEQRIRIRLSKVTPEEAEATENLFKLFKDIMAISERDLAATNSVPGSSLEFQKGDAEGRNSYFTSIALQRWKGKVAPYRQAAEAQWLRLQRAEAEAARLAAAAGTAVQ